MLGRDDLSSAASNISFFSSARVRCLWDDFQRVDHSFVRQGQVTGGQVRAQLNRFDHSHNIRALGINTFDVGLHCPACGVPSRQPWF